MNIKVLLSFCFIGLTLAQSQRETQNLNAFPTQQKSSPLIGVRFSAATDVSHISYNSPSVSYGASLDEIQLPAAPVQPVSLKQAPQEVSENQHSLVRNSAGEQIQQVSAQGLPLAQGHQPQIAQPQFPANPQFLSVQQYPSNPQFETASPAAPVQPQQIVIRQNFPGPQVQTYSPNIYQPQPQPQPQYQFPVQQSPIASPNYPSVPLNPNPYFANPANSQQYPSQYPVQQPVPAFPQQSPTVYSSAPSSTNAYFATGPFAAPQPAPLSFAPAQYSAPAPQLGYPGASTALVSRVAFNRPGAGFSYGF